MNSGGYSPPSPLPKSATGCCDNTVPNPWWDGIILGDAEETCIVEPLEECSGTTHADTAILVRQMYTYQERGRRRKLLEIIVEPDLPEQDKTPLCNFLMDHHDVFKGRSTPGFLKLISCGCQYACVCVSAPRAIKNYSREMKSE